MQTLILSSIKANANTIKSIEEEMGTITVADAEADLQRLHLSRCDPYSAFIETTLTMVAEDPNERATLDNIEQEVVFAGKLLRTKMEVAALAHFASASNFANSNVDGPLSGTLFAFETNSQGMSIEEMPPMMVAAIDASNRFHGRRSKPDQWKEDAKFSLACRTQISTMSLFVSQIRVLKQGTFIQLESYCLGQNQTRAEEFRAHRSFITSKCGEDGLASTLAVILEDAIVPFTTNAAMNGDADSARKLLLEMLVTRIFLVTMAMPKLSL